MSIARPSFEKKEMAISSSPYVYLPVDIPAYTVEVTHQAPIDGELLQRALDRTCRRMPYLTDTMLEPVLAANERLAKSSSARLRLQNPPKYKPKKQKRPGLLQSLMGGGQPGGIQQ